MVIQHAERFGLSTLHQLRGRVGRAEHASTCLLIADTRAPGSARRIDVMTNVSDGFRLSEEDLKLRGPGEVMGVMQHGLPVFKVGNLIQDAGLIQQARAAAEDLLAADHDLRNPSCIALKEALHKQHGSHGSSGITGSFPCDPA